MNSKEYTDYLVEQLTELRDLIILIERGGNDTPDVLYKLALEKSRHITSYVQQWREEAAPAEVQIPAEYAEWVMGKTTEEAVIDEKREQAAKADEEMEKSVVDMPMDVALPLEKREAEPSDESADTPLPEETVDVPVVEMPFLSVEVGADTDDTVVEFPEDAPVGEVSLVVDDEEEAAGEPCTEQEAPAGGPQAVRRKGRGQTRLRSGRGPGRIPCRRGFKGPEGHGAEIAQLIKENKDW